MDQFFANASNTIFAVCHNKWWSPQLMTKSLAYDSDVSRAFLGQTSTHIKPTKAPPWLALSQEIFKICTFRYSKNALLALSVFRFPCKTFSKLLNLTLRKTLFCGWFLKSSYIQIRNLYGCKLARVAKRSELIRCSK